MSKFERINCKYFYKGLLLDFDAAFKKLGSSILVRKHLAEIESSKMSLDDIHAERDELLRKIYKRAMSRAMSKDASNYYVIALKKDCNRLIALEKSAEKKEKQII